MPEISPRTARTGATAPLGDAQWKVVSGDDLSDPLAYHPARAEFKELMDENGWSGMGSKNTAEGPVQLWKKSTAGMLCLRSRIDAPDFAPKALADVVADIDNVGKWAGNGISDGGILNKSLGKQSYWQVMDVPGWTFQKDKFWGVDATTTVDDQGVYRMALIKGSDATRDAAREAKSKNWRKAVELKNIMGTWTVFPSESGGSVLQYEGGIDIGLPIPRFLQESLAKSVAPDGLANAVTEARKRQG